MKKIYMIKVRLGEQRERERYNKVRLGEYSICLHGILVSGPNSSRHPSMILSPNI